MFQLLMRWMKARRMLPQISETERQALEAGTVWIERDFFSGRADFRRLLAEPYRELTLEERQFLEGPVEQLLAMLDRYQISRSKRIPDEVLQFIKDQGFMSFLIPAAYGGRPMSTLAISTILSRIGPVSATVGTFVVIPNSLGAAELIVHYGTSAQKDHYLPRLARGEYVPCFGLTEPGAGSDAASIRAEARVFRDEDGALKLRMNFRKRYITLAPVANLCTIACRLSDPDGLLRANTATQDADLGISCVLVHADTPGLLKGSHHDPIGDPFYNGPLIGTDVVVPIDNIIGGAQGAGQGWRMLMEQLAGGRAVSLPAGAVGAAKTVVAAASAYSMVRQQFGLQIGRMEGVEEKLGRITALSYLLEAARVFGCSALDNGHQPPVVSAVLKAYSTELSRQISIDGMDVFAGAGVMQGPNNIVGSAYASAPVGVTVEGANILTRTLMIFGQGATRCHPHAMDLIRAVEDDDAAKFRSGLVAWIAHFIAGFGRSLGHALTRGQFVAVPDVAPATRGLYRRLGWASARFGLMTDLAMFLIGGRLKRRGKLTGRYADVLAWLLLASSALRRFEAEGRRPEDLPLVQYAVEHSLWQIQQAFEAIYRNFGGFAGVWLRSIGLMLLRLNPLGAAPTDLQSHRAALCMQSDGAQFRRLSAHVHVPPDPALGLGRLMHAFRLVSQAHPAAERIIRAQKAGSLPPHLLPAELADRAARAGLIDPREAELLKQALAARMAAIEVDEFTPGQYFLAPDAGPPARIEAAARAGAVAA